MADRMVKVLVTGDTKAFISAMDAAGYSAGDTAGKIGDHFDKSTSRVGGAFTSLGNQLSNWGLPFGNSIAGVGTRLDEAKAKGNGFGASMSALAGPVVLGMAAAVGVVGAATVKMAADFQTSMTQLVTGAGESEKNIKMVGNGILALAGPMGTTTQQLSSGMYMIESAGYHGAAGLTVLKAAAEGAKVGNADLGTVANAVTTALTDYHLPAAQAADVTSKLVATVASGKTHMEDLAGSLAKVLPAASVAGVGLNQVLGAMATMTAQGTDAASAATYLRQTILQLSNPTAKARAEMESLGLNVIDVSKNLGQRGLTGTLDLLTNAIASHMGPAGTVLIEQMKAASKNTTKFQQVLANLPPTQQTYISALADMVGGTKSMQAALELTGSNAATFNTNVKNIGATTTEAGGNVKGFALIHKDLNFQMDQAKNTVQALGIRIGDILIPKLESVMQVLGKATQFLMTHKAVMEAVGITIGVVGAGMLVVWVSNTIAAMAFWTAATGGIILLVAALAVGIAWISTHWTEVWATVKSIFDDASNFVKSHLEMIGAALIVLTGGLSEVAVHWRQIWDDMRVVVNDVWHSIDNDVFHPLESFFRMFAPVIDAFRAVWNVAWTVISGALTTAWSIMQPVFKFIISNGIQIVQQAAQWLQTAWQAVWPVISTALSVAWDIMKVIFEAIEIIAIIPLGLAVLVLQGIWDAAWLVVSTALSVAWDVMKPVFGFISTVGINIVKGDITAFQAVWNAVWPVISAALSAAWSVMEPVFKFIISNGIQIVQQAAQWLQTAWQTVWPVISSALSAAWSVMSPVFGFIKTLGVDVISAAASALQWVWAIVWGGLSSAISAAWSGMSATFGFITNAINTVIGLINDLITAYNHIPLLPNVPTIPRIGPSYPVLPGGAQGPVQPGHAIGTGMGTFSGMTWVGELGPELVNFGSPVQIIPNSVATGGVAIGATRGAARSAGAGGVQVTSSNTYNLYGTPQEMIAQMEAIQDRHDQELIQHLAGAA